MCLGQGMSSRLFWMHVTAGSPGRGVFKVSINPVGVGKVPRVLAVSA